MFNFDFSKCKPLPNGKPAWDHPQTSKNWHPVALALAETTMVIGLSGITEKNAHAFYVRLSVYQRIIGPLIKYGDGTDAYITEEDVQQYIGMTTNTANRTEAEFDKHMMRLARESYLVTKFDNDGRTACGIVEKQAEKYAAEQAKSAPAKKAAKKK